MDLYQQITNENAFECLANAQSFYSTIEYPENKFNGRGIVIPAGRGYFIGGYCLIRLLRDLGCNLPIELWHLDGEIYDWHKPFIEELNITLKNADGINKTINSKKVAGYCIKPFSILHSDFEEVLYMDADIVPAINPETLFETTDYKETGTIFFSDHTWAHYASKDLSNILKIEKFNEQREFDSGIIYINKKKNWAEINLTMWLNETSEFWYKKVHGDKDTFHIAWEFNKKKYYQNLSGRGWPHGIGHFDENALIFQHRVHDKFRLFVNNKTNGYINEDKCFEYKNKLEKVFMSEPSNVKDHVTKNRWIYERVGYDQREMTFGENGFITEGQAGRERQWYLEGSDIVVTNEYGEITCKCVFNQEINEYHGKWLVHEKMPIKIFQYSDNPNFYNIRNGYSGLFSLFKIILVCAEKSIVKGQKFYINVPESAYLDKDVGPNVFNYYFEQQEYPKYSTNTTTSGESVFPPSDFRNTFRKRFNPIIKETFKLKKEVNDKIEDFYTNNMAGKRCLGLHYRSLDKVKETHIYDILDYDAYLEKLVKDLNIECLFVCTDTIEALEFFSNKYKDIIKFTDCLRKPKDHKIGLQYHTDYSKYKLGEEAILDCWLLSKCYYLLSGVSNFPDFAVMLNPDLIHILYR